MTVAADSCAVAGSLNKEQLIKTKKEVGIFSVGPMKSEKKIKKIKQKSGAGVM